MLTAILTATSTGQLASQLDHANRQAEAMEWRLDYLDQIDLKALANLREKAKIPVIFTLRGCDQGGQFKGDEKERLDMINRLAVLKPDYFDLEHTISVNFLERFHYRHQNIKILRSFHDFSSTPDDLIGILRNLRHPVVSLYKLITFAPSTLDAMRIVQLVNKVSVEIPIVAHAMGEKGIASRILGAVLGNRLTYAKFSGDVPAPGLLSIRDLKRIYRFNQLNKETAIYALLGDPVGQSPGHIYHNKVFDKDGTDAVYVKLQVLQGELPEFFKIARTLPFKGFSVTMPLKEAILDFIDEIDGANSELGSFNTLCVRNEKIVATNTDGPGALDVLEGSGLVRQKSVLLIGAGGAAKAIACEAIRRGAQVMIINRDDSKVRALSKQLNCGGVALNKISEWATRSYDIIIKAIPDTALEEEVKNLVLGPATHPGTRVMDIVYHPRETLFLKAARARGLETVTGRAMFRRQAALQQSWWSGMCLE